MDRVSTAVTDRKVFERYLTREEEKQLFKYVSQFRGLYARRDLAWMQLLRQTGIRVGALCKITLQQAQDAIRTQYLELEPEQLKGGVRRGRGGTTVRRGQTVRCNTAAVAALKSLVALRKEQGVPGDAAAPLVLARGKRRTRTITVRQLQKRMAHWVLASGLEIDATPHWWRHTLAKRLMASSTAEDPQGMAQLALGHSKRETTAIYTLPDRESWARAMEDASK